MTWPRRALTALWLAAFFVCPLVFFTDLTRNPYASQIVLLHIAAAAAVALCAWSGAAEGEWSVPRTPVDASLAVWILVCAASWGWSYTHHVPFFRESMRTQGAAAGAFIAACMLAPFYFGALCARRGPCDREPVLSGGWPMFALVWGVLWTLHSSIITPAPALTLDGHLWDPYGGLLWIAGFAVVVMMSKRSSVHDFWRASLAVAFLSGAYGICQYFGLEMIWPRALNPYGGRSVSTFGNPNFVSSYIVVLLPVAFLYYLKARRWAERIAYAAVILAMEGCLLSSLTRSSWIGALVGLAVLFAWKPVRTLVASRRKVHAGMLALVAVLVLAWPHTSVQGPTPTVVGRVAELERIFESHPAEVYSPFYQRVLIWACAWQMGRENPALGKGWGVFEMFYPFYQGNLLARFDLFRTMRTHGNGAHNEILETWSQTGAVGVGVVFWIWLTFFICVRRWLLSGAIDEWGLSAAAGVAGMLADNLLNVSMHFAVPAFVFWWQAGVVMGLARPQGEAWRRWRLGRTPAIAAAALVAALCGGYGWWWVRQWNRDVHYFLGFKLLHAGRVPSAVDELDTAYSWNGREVNSDYELGNAYARSERYDRAVWAYGEALNSNSGYDEIYYNIGTLLTQRLAQPEKGLDYFRVAHWINPLMLEPYAALASYYMNHLDRDAAPAREVLAEGAHFFPNNAAILANLGYLYGIDHQDAKAIEFQSRALRLDPDLAVAEQNLRNVLTREGRSNDPILAELKSYHDLNAAIARKDFSDATLELARKVARTFPDALKPSLYAGNLEAVHGHPDLALAWLEPLTAKEPRNAALWQNVGEVYLRLGRRDDALRAYRSAVQFDPGNEAVRRRLDQLMSVPR